MVKASGRRTSKEALVLRAEDLQDGQADGAELVVPRPEGLTIDDGSFAKDCLEAMIVRYLVPKLPEGVVVVRIHDAVMNASRVLDEEVDLAGIEAEVPDPEGFARAFFEARKIPTYFVYDASDEGFEVQVLDREGTHVRTHRVGNAADPSWECRDLRHPAGHRAALPKAALLERARWFALEVAEEASLERLMLGEPSADTFRRAPETALLAMEAALEGRDTNLEELEDVAAEVGSRFGLVGDDMFLNFRLFRGKDYRIAFAEDGESDPVGS